MHISLYFSWLNRYKPLFTNSNTTSNFSLISIDHSPEYLQKFLSSCVTPLATNNPLTSHSVPTYRYCLPNIAYKKAQHSKMPPDNRIFRSESPLKLNSLLQTPPILFQSIAEVYLSKMKKKRKEKHTCPFQRWKTIYFPFKNWLIRSLKPERK